MKKIWNRFTDIFGRTIFHPQFIMNSYTREAIKITKKYAKGKLLDVGSGRAPYKKEILGYVKSYEGLDHPSHGKHFSSSKPDVYADAGDLPFDKSSFDTLIMLQVIEYLENPQKVFEEAGRVLKKGGIYIISSPFMYPVHDGILDRNRFTQTALTSMLSKAKFKILKASSQGTFWEFWLQSLLVYYFKSTKNFLEKGNTFKSFVGIPTLIIGFAITPFINVLAILLKFLSRSGDFPLNILIVARRKITTF